MTYLAHSARNGCPGQPYQEHVENVWSNAVQNAKDAARYAVFDKQLLKNAVETAALVHDLGKLHAENQEVLHQKDNHASLPIHHQDAGVAFLKECQSDYPRLAVSAHHSGLPVVYMEERRGEDRFRDRDIQIRSKVNAEIDNLAELHHKITGVETSPFYTCEAEGDKSVFLRMMLSCLADADHTDTARHYQRVPQKQDEDIPLLRAEERLAKLNNCVAGLINESERSKLRAEMYWACRDSSIKANIVSCDSPVGSAKTTALMAHALQQAVSRKARRIFVVLPFTNIISQSVEIYRKVLKLPGERPENVVAELHHRADFENEDTRALTAQWRAPIVVTTAVSFFETLASNMPSALRRLHELPGSVIFVDEAHAALPVKLLPTAWHWMQVLADEWSCYWILASGSLVEFWNLEDLAEKQRVVPQIVSTTLRNKLMQYEASRIRFSYKPEPLSCDELVEWVASSPGPRLLIMNTVQSAAVVAQDMRNYYGKGQEHKVMHLSTALTAQDREKTLQAVKDRLGNKEDTDWTLVATSCVEAGVDFSFRTGFREMASLLSLLQAAGRVNREGIEEMAEIWSFVMKDDAMLTSNEGIKDAAYVLKRYFERKVAICPELSTRSIEDELKRGTVHGDAVHLLEAELCQQFPEVQEKFRVIEEDTVLVVVDSTLREQLRYGSCDWKAIQRNAVSVRKYRVKQLHLQQLTDGIYDWNLEYDDFLGIMKGILCYLKSKSEPLIL